MGAYQLGVIFAIQWGSRNDVDTLNELLIALCMMPTPDAADVWLNYISYQEFGQMGRHRFCCLQFSQELGLSLCFCLPKPLLRRTKELNERGEADHLRKGLLSKTQGRGYWLHYHLPASRTLRPPRFAKGRPNRARGCLPFAHAAYYDVGSLFRVDQRQIRLAHQLEDRRPGRKVRSE